VILNLSTEKASPTDLTIQGINRIVLHDVVVGEVWLASGQSNMQLILQSCLDAPAAIAASDNPMIREFHVSDGLSDKPESDCAGGWVVATPQTSPGFSAVGYFFAYTLQKKLGVPIGIIHSSYGSSQIEAWTSREALDSNADLREGSRRVLTSIEAFPSERLNYEKAYQKWLEETGRTDRESVHAAEWAAPAAPNEGWTQVVLPLLPPPDGLPKFGAYWLRRQIVTPPNLADRQIAIGFHDLSGFGTIYWNGEQVASTSYRDIAPSFFVIPRDKVKAGTNTLAIRVYSPELQIRIASIAIDGVLVHDWSIRAEYDLPPLPPAITPPTRPLDLVPVPGRPSVLFNAMIAPLIPYAIRGVIWYQGESNAGYGWQYRTAFPLMISDWRRQWNRGQFPFYFCQLANYAPKYPAPGDGAWTDLRESQWGALAVPKTGGAVLIDVGEAQNIHPADKKTVGERLAALALANDYGFDVPAYGPTFVSVKFGQGVAEITFTHIANGLVARPLPPTYTLISVNNTTAPLIRNSPNSEVEGFAICGKDREWVWADARIAGSKVVVWSDKVPEPIAVRYAWADNPTCNLYNQAGFPAAPFRTDDFPTDSRNRKYGF